MKLGRREFDFVNHCYILGILNVTPDSFSDGGRFDTVDRALYRAEEMARAGADIIDVGAESTRPGHRVISPAEEAERLYPVLEALHSRIALPISLDSYKWQTVEAFSGLIALVNDVKGLRQEAQMAKVIAKHDLACCLMHSRTEAVTDGFWEMLRTELQESCDIAAAAGIAKEKILLDPGIGFGKTPEQNLSILKRLGELRDLGYPLLVGASRKSFIGLALGKDVHDRLFGSLAATAAAVLGGASVIRVHDVAENRDVVDLCLAIRKEEFNGQN